MWEILVDINSADLDQNFYSYLIHFRKPLISLLVHNQLPRDIALEDLTRKTTFAGTITRKTIVNFN